MRLATLADDFWELDSAEELNLEHPKTFWIPSREERNDLRRGSAAKLVFEIEGEDEDGSLAIQGERMWVLVAERIGHLYVGVLDSQPASLAPEDDVYLGRGAEVAFGPEHIIDIESPPSDYAERRLAEPPKADLASRLRPLSTATYLPPGDEPDPARQQLGPW